MKATNNADLICGCNLCRESKTDTQYQARARGFRAAHSFCFLLGSVAALIIASHYTMPLGRSVLPHHPLLEATRTIASFAVAGCCISFAQVSMKRRIDIPLIGGLHAAFALAVSLTAYGAVSNSVPLSIVGALLAADGAMLGACITKALSR